jgi:multicomponent Na+:H+ antiporter subunit D
MRGRREHKMNVDLHPGLIMMVCGLLTAVLPEKARKAMTITGPVLAFLAFLTLDGQSTLKYSFMNRQVELINFDGLATAFMLVFCVIAVLNAVYSLTLQDKFEAGMSMLYAGSAMSVVLAGDLISFIFFWEISAFASTYLIYARHCRKSSRAAFRYILIHSFGGNMLLVGIIMQLLSHGSDIVNISGTHDMAFWFILIGIGINAAIPPLNGWLADAYPEATVTGTLYMGSYTTKAAIYALIRFFAGTEMLIWIGAFMAIYAACMAIMENDIRRLLSYHIISQLGMMVTSLAVGSQMGIDGASAHAATNIIFKGVILMGAGAVIVSTGRSKITELGGLAKKMPVVAVCFLISSLAIAGLPFLSGFASKALIMEGLHRGGYDLAAVLLSVAGVGTLLSITLKINYFVFFGKTDLDVEAEPVPVSMQIAMICGTAISVITGVRPQILYSFTAYGSNVDPFTLPHIMEYVAIFIGGSIPFFIYLKRMKPHDDLTLDFDWFFRKPFNAFIMWLSKVIYAFMDVCDRSSLSFVQYIGSRFANPYLWTMDSHSVKIRNMSFENEDRTIGGVIELAVCALAVIFIAVVSAAH